MKKEDIVIGERYRVICCNKPLSVEDEDSDHRIWLNHVVTVDGLTSCVGYPVVEATLVGGNHRNFWVTGLVPILTKKDIMIGGKYRVLITLGERLGRILSGISSHSKEYFNKVVTVERHLHYNTFECVTEDGEVSRFLASGLGLLDVGQYTKVATKIDAPDGLYCLCDHVIPTKTNWALNESFEVCCLCKRERK